MRSRTNSRTPAGSPAGSLVLVGVGNIGSHLVPLLARMARVRRVTLVDHDVYEARNFSAQAMPRAAIGKSKAAVQAAILRRLNPQLEVAAIPSDLGSTPWGQLRASLIVTCLDSLAARLAANEIAWRLGVAWLDSGVFPADQLARVTAYQPATDSPCLACGLGDADFANLAGSTPCQPLHEPAPTNGTAALGALTAAMLALEIERVLDTGSLPLAGREWLLDARHRRQFVTSLRRDPGCRFDHSTLRIQPRRLSVEFSPEQAMRFAIRVGKLCGDLSVAVAGQRWATALHCPRCGAGRRGLHLLGRRRGPLARCACCNVALQATAFHILERLDRRLPPAQWRLPLKSLGVDRGDIITISSPEGSAHFEATRGSVK